MIALALILATAPDAIESGYRRFDITFDCALHGSAGDPDARYAVFFPGSMVRYRPPTAPTAYETPDDEPNLKAYDPARLIRIGMRASPIVSTQWNARRQIQKVGLGVPNYMAEGIHGETWMTGEQGGTLLVEDLDRAAGTARATIVQYADSKTQAPKATYTGACRFTEGRRALPEFESITT